MVSLKCFQQQILFCSQSRTVDGKQIWKRAFVWFETVDSVNLFYSFNWLNHIHYNLEISYFNRFMLQFVPFVSIPLKTALEFAKVEHSFFIYYKSICFSFIHLSCRRPVSFVSTSLANLHGHLQENCSNSTCCKWFSHIRIPLCLGWEMFGESRSRSVDRWKSNPLPISIKLIGSDLIWFDFFCINMHLIAPVNFQLSNSFKKHRSDRKQEIVA